MVVTCISKILLVACAGFLLLLYHLPIAMLPVLIVARTHIRIKVSYHHHYYYHHHHQTTSNKPCVTKFATAPISLLTNRRSSTFCCPCLASSARPFSAKRHTEHISTRCLSRRLPMHMHAPHWISASRCLACRLTSSSTRACCASFRT